MVPLLFSPYCCICASTKPKYHVSGESIMGNGQKLVHLVTVTKTEQSRTKFKKHLTSNKIGSGYMSTTFGQECCRFSININHLYSAPQLSHSAAIVLCACKCSSSELCSEWGRRHHEWKGGSNLRKMQFLSGDGLWNSSAESVAPEKKVMILWKDVSFF